MELPATATPETEQTHETITPDAKVLILDAGSQYGKVIDRRIRELGVRCDIAPLDTPTEIIKQYDAVIISGGPASVGDDDAPKYNPDMFEMEDIPKLVICYGMQLAAHHYGGKVGEHEGIREDGRTKITVNPEAKIFNGLDVDQTVINSHGQSVTQLPPGFEATATSENGVIAGFQSEQFNIHGTQFHPEVTHTVNGNDMISNFLFNVANLEQDYTPDDKMQEVIDTLKADVGDRDLVMFLSGGLDSSTVAGAIKAANLPGTVKFAMVDTGMLREGEAEESLVNYAEMGIEVDVIDASTKFMGASTERKDGSVTPPLSESLDNQEIRHIVGDTFVRTFEQYLADCGLDPSNTILGMGTLRPDLIESGSALASVNTEEGGIKIHHNDTELVRRLRELGLVTEPLKNLHKDEVRQVARLLELPEAIITRQPSPGPSGAVRIMQQIEPFYAAVATPEMPMPERLEAINKELREYNVAQKLGVVAVATRTVGVQGDKRSERLLVVATTDVDEPDFKMLEEIGLEIPRRHHGVSRLVYASGDVLHDSAPNDVLDGITRTYVDQEAMDLWREVDWAGRQVMEKYGLNDTTVISQIPFIINALNFGEAGQRSAVARPFLTEDYMTGEAAIPGDGPFPMEAYHELVSKLSAVEGIGRVLYDLSGKPPGTTEHK